MRELGVELEQEDASTGFMGVTLERDLMTGNLEMKHTGLIQRIIEAVSLDDGMSKGEFTTPEANNLVKDENGEPSSKMFRYSSVVNMLLHISVHTHPDASLAVNISAQ